MFFNNKKAAIIPSGINPAAIMRGAGLIGKSTVSAATNIGGGLFGGLGFGIGGKLTDAVSRSAMGIKPLLIAIAFDTFAYFTGEVNPVFGIFFHVIIAWILLSKYLPGDKPLRILLWSKISVLIYVLVLGFFPTILNILPELHRWIFLTVGNHAFPIATMYIIFTGFISNRTGGILVQIIYAAAFISLIFFAYDKAQDEIGDLFSKAGIDIKATMPAEQKTVFATFVQDLIHSTKKTGGTFVNAMRNSPRAIASFIDPKISAAGGESLFGKEKEEQPKLGIVLEPHPSGATKLKKGEDEVTIVKGLITIPNPLEDRSFLTVTSIRCYHTKSKSDAEIDGEVLEYKPEDLQKGVNVFYNRPLTVSCEFKTDDLLGISTVTLAVGYDFESNAKLITYVMKDDLLEDLLIRNEDPLDYMAVPANKRSPSTKFDNGPARFGIGPVELNNPPLGVREGKTYPNFELVIGNKASDFNGYIGKINNIVITLPRGFSLTEDISACPFKKTSDNPPKYSINEKAMEAKSTDFTTIKTSRLYTCPMSITAEEALGAVSGLGLPPITGSVVSSPTPQIPSWREVEFSVDADFTYEAETELSTKPRS